MMQIIRSFFNAFTIQIAFMFHGILLSRVHIVL